MKRSILLWVMLAALSFTSVVQAGPGAKPFTGTITFSIKSSGDMPPELQSMMPTKATYTIGEQHSKIEMTPSMMGGGAVVMNHENQTMRTMMEWNGKKYQVVMDENMKEQAAMPKNISYTTEKRTIAGYPCTKAVVDTGDGSKVEVWFTEKIQVKNLDKMWGSLKGFPLEFTNSMQGITMVYTATNVSAVKIDKEVFTIPAEFQTVSQNEIMQLLSTMGRE